VGVSRELCAVTDILKPVHSGKVHPKTCYEGTERDCIYSSTLSLTSALCLLKPEPVPMVWEARWAGLEGRVKSPPQHQPHVDVLRVNPGRRGEWPATSCVSHVVTSVLCFPGCCLHSQVKKQNTCLKKFWGFTYNVHTHTHTHTHIAY
jgi:hypothetical protein